MIAARHVEALSVLKDLAELRYIVSRHPGRARSLAESYSGPEPRFISNVSIVVDDPSVQMVIVATPPDVRIELIKALAQAGKHILLEKPIARTLAEAEQVVSVCEREDVLLGVLFQHRMEAENYAVAGLHFESGAVGSLVASTATYPHGRESIAIHCPKGSLRIYTDVLEIDLRDGRREQLASLHGSGEEQSAVPKYRLHKTVIDDFIRAMHEERSSAVNGRAVLEAHRLIDAIETSSRDGVMVELAACV